MLQNKNGIPTSLGLKILVIQRQKKKRAKNALSLTTPTGAEGHASWRAGLRVRLSCVDTRHARKNVELLGSLGVFFFFSHPPEDLQKKKKKSTCRWVGGRVGGQIDAHPLQ